MIRKTGYYWIVVGSDLPEIGCWDADTESWGLIGNYDGIEETKVSVISEQLPQPTYWRVLPK